MHRYLTLATAVAALAVSGAAVATGSCPVKDTVPKAQWQDKDLLEKKLVAAGWQVRRIKADGQCYEVFEVHKGDIHVHHHQPWWSIVKRASGQVHTLAVWRLVTLGGSLQLLGPPRTGLPSCLRPSLSRNRA